VLHDIIEYDRIDRSSLRQALRKVFINGKGEVPPGESAGCPRDLHSERLRTRHLHGEQKATEAAPQIQNTFAAQGAEDGDQAV
jgi:hypothetical protein